MKQALQVWPVIHVGVPRIDVENARIARHLGASGVMLISMVGRNDDLECCARALRAVLPDLKVGVNYLGMNTPDAVNRAYCNEFDAFWTDNQEFDGAVPFKEQPFFKAVAFKGQPNDPRPWDSARIATQLRMIPTTSGPATGMAPDLQKIRLIRGGLEDDQALAIASGATPENIGMFSPFLSHVLVSTGISHPHSDRFDESRLAEFMTSASAPR